MCNLSEAILENGIEIGWLSAKCNAIRNAYGNMSLEDIVNILKYEECFVKKVVTLLNQYPYATDEQLVELLRNEEN